MKAQKMTIKLERSSFRDPNGFVYYQGNQVFRQVNESYKTDLDQLEHSGLLAILMKEGLLLPHEKISPTNKNKKTLAIFRAQTVPFISYPYEWSFSQLKDAAILTLKILKLSLEHGMTLKDASAYNIQFIGTKPFFIDLLSFETYVPGKPWIAYKQFCQHFLGPLLLMSLVDIRLSQLLRIHIDGIPLDVVSKLLPKKTYLSFAIASHIHLHSHNQLSYADGSKQGVNPNYSLNKMSLLGIIASLETLIHKLTYEGKPTEWGEYYTFTNYSDKAFKNKKKIIDKYLKIAQPKTVWDIGANNGEFSRIASDKNIYTISSDLDPIAVEKNYLRAKNQGDKHLLPLLIDLTNPSPALGWANQERSSFIERGPTDTVMALALIHHLAISNNLPLPHIANFCHQIGKFLLIEFIPKSDSQVQKLLRTRVDIFDDYTQAKFEESFSKRFKILNKSTIPDSQRTLYLMKSV